jgi:hypothetical protein
MLRVSTILAVSLLPPLLGLAATPPNIHSTEPRRADRTVTLEEIWRVGGEDDPDHLFGVMIDARCDADGNVYLLDQQLATVTVIGPGGEDVATLGGEGDGPGECRMPQTMMLFDDGTVGLGQRFPGRFVRVDLQNDPQPSVDLGGPDASREGYTMLLSARNRGGTILVTSLHQVPREGGQTRDSFLWRLGTDGSILAEYATASTFLDFRKAHFVETEMVAPFVTAHTVGPGGRVYFTPERDAYRIAVHAPDGTPLHTITRAFENPRRDQQTLDRMDALFAEQDRALPFDITWEVSPVDPAIDELHVTAGGDLLVHHARSMRDLPDGVFARYDVFDASGHWRERLDVRCEASPDHDGLIWLDDGRVLLVRGLQLARLTASGNGGAVTDEDDGAWAIEVVCCRVVG